ncbi:MAG: vWA domain-containing protein [Haloferacaceae archaeon]
MTDNNGRLDLSRRKLLGSVATLGAAGAIGGAGSMAFFSDEESYANNQLVAGELDLKIDWEEHYSDWKGDETSEAEMADPDGDPDYLLPAFRIASDSQFASGGTTGQIGPLADGIDMAPGDGRPIALNFTNSQDDFWDATAVEAYPDTNDDGLNDGVPDDICETDADLPGALDSDNRTESSRGDPLIALDDVKPGDFGEVTFSFHMCDNPGYVWLTGGLVDADENGNTEPEADDKDELGPGEGPQGDLFDNEGDESGEENADSANTTKERVELLDYVLTRVWRDDGNNQVDQISGQLDVVCAIDTSGSLNNNERQQLENGVNDFIDALDSSGADAKVGTLQFGGGSVDNLTPLNSSGPDITISSTNGNTPMPGALDIADQLVNDTGAGARSGAQKVVVLFTDGGPNYENTSYSAGGYTAPRDSSGAWSATSGDSTYDNAGSGPPTTEIGDPQGSGFVTEGEMDETLGVASSVKSGGTQIATVYVGEDGADREAMTQPAVDTYDTLPTYLASSGPIASSAALAFDVDVGNLPNLANQLAGLVTTSEQILFFGTLRDALKAVEGSPGIPLDGDIPAEEAGGTGRPCFDSGSTQYIGFEWWLPVNHGNQIQGDSVSFDLGFYTEQCRHNDGSGQVGNA